MRLLVQLGSNIAPREIHLARARKLCAARIGTIRKQSSIYQTAAWGRTDQADFLNQVIELDTDLAARPCLAICQTIEQELGRVRDERWGPRTIDLDLLLLEDQMVETEELVLPHPRLAVRRFVLLPLCEIAPRMEHPLLKRSMKRLLTACPDDGKVLRWLRF